MNGRSRNFYMLLAFQFIVTTLYWILYLFRNRLKDNFMSTLVGLTALYHLLFILTMEALAGPMAESITWLSKVAFTFVSVATNFLLLTPSISYACLVYLPFYMGTICFVAFRHSMNKKQLIQTAYACAICMLFWLIY